jgi:hypothetical protein
LTAAFIFGGSYERDTEKNNPHQSGFIVGHCPRLFIRFPPSLFVQTLGGLNFKFDKRYYNRAGNQAGRG